MATSTDLRTVRYYRILSLVKRVLVLKVTVQDARPSQTVVLTSCYSYVRNRCPMDSGMMFSEQYGAYPLQGIHDYYWLSLDPQ